MKNNKKSYNIVPFFDRIVFILSLLFFQSVLTVAHHTSHWIHDGTSRIVESPTWLYLAISLAVIGYQTVKLKRAPSNIVIISVVILITASVFWLSGLRTNFYF